MEILFVSHKYPPSVGGMEKQSFELIEGMSRWASVHRIVYTGQESRIQFFLSLENRIAEMCRRFPAISIIHFNDALVAAACLRHKKYKHLKRAVTVHGLDVVFPNKIYQKHIFAAFNRFDLIIAVSNATANACLERGMDPNKVKVVLNGVDHLLLDAKPDPDFLQAFQDLHGLDLKGKVVLTALGRPVTRKGFSWFIENVFPKLQGNFVLLLIGAFNPSRTWTDKLIAALPANLRSQLQLALGYPTDENAIRALLIQTGNQSTILHLGKLPYDELIQVLSLTSALLMPNREVQGDMEGFGLVGLEASLCGSWVFASGIHGITDAIHPGKNGTLLPPEDAALWADTLNDFISNPAHFNPSPNQTRQFTAENFSWEKMVKGYFDLFSNF